MLQMSQAGVPAWLVIEARGTVEPPQFFVFIMCPSSKDRFVDNFSRLYDFPGQLLTGGDLQIPQSCMWDQNQLAVRSEELDLRGKQRGRQRDEHTFGDCRAVEQFP
jgi:hypothetical protein